MERCEEQGLWWEEANSYLNMFYSGAMGIQAGISKNDWPFDQELSAGGWGWKRRVKCTNRADGTDEGELAVTFE